MHVDGFAPGARVLLIDDVLATGGTLQAGCKLIEQAGGQVACCAILVELSFLGGRERLRPYEVRSLIRY
jgi:adenine phosphoribosyltransferase